MGKFVPIFCTIGSICCAGVAFCVPIGYDKKNQKNGFKEDISHEDAAPVVNALDPFPAQTIPRRTAERLADCQPARAARRNGVGAAADLHQRAAAQPDDRRADGRRAERRAAAAGADGAGTVCVADQRRRVVPAQNAGDVPGSADGSAAVLAEYGRNACAVAGHPRPGRSAGRGLHRHGAADRRRNDGGSVADGDGAGRAAGRADADVYTVVSLRLPGGLLRCGSIF